MLWGSSRLLGALGFLHDSALSLRHNVNMDIGLGQQHRYQAGDSQGLPFHPILQGGRGCPQMGISVSAAASLPPDSPPYTSALEFSGFSWQCQPWASCISSSLTMWG